MDERTAQIVRRVFWIMNKFLMIPMIRMGFLPFMGTPLSGWIMMLTTTGRVTGKRRFTPLNYALVEGNVYVLAGFGKIAHWYRNAQANPGVEVLLPSGPLAGRAADVTDPEERLRILRQILKNSGFAAFLFGINPFAISDERLREETADYHVLRITPKGVGSGVGDPGGLLWLWWIALVVAIVLLTRPGP